ncbi:MAG: alkyl hydroperoxide reductase, partial [Aureliella sp.]
DTSQVKQEVFTLMAIDQEFEIPAGADNFSVHASTRSLPPGAELLAITPHMHFRGKSFRLFGAAGQSETLLRVPNYDFNWQHTYQLQQPLPLDAFESGLQFEAAFDNSARNPFNPDPTQTVTWGDQSWEEMAVAFFEVARPRQADASTRPVSTQDGLNNELTEQQRTVKRQADIEAYIQLVFDKLDGNGDGQIHKSEADIVVRRLHFDLWDLDDDQVATAAEVRQTAEKLFPH